MKKYITLIVSTMLVSTTVQAVRLGTDVSESDYKDYVVRIEVPQTDDTTVTCGGLLIGGKYILTAAHCVGTATQTTTSEGYSSWTYDWGIDSTAPNTITVYQGVEFDSDTYTETTYDVVDLVDDEYEDAYALATEEHDYVETQYASADWARDDILVTKSAFFNGSYHDVALLELSDTISQKTHPALIPIFDNDTNTFNINIDDTFTFRGWGDDETGSNPDIMQETELSWAFDGSNHDRYHAAIPTEVNDDVECTNTADDQCIYNRRDVLRLTPTTVNATPDSGDSGTPLTNDDDGVFSLAKARIVESGFYTTRMTYLTWYIPYIIDAINEVVAPTAIEFSSSDDSTSTAFKVQNLSNSTETISPSLSGDNAENFTVSGCDSVALSSSESCEITLTYNGETDGDSATLSLNDSQSTDISATYYVSSDDDTFETSSSGGGALGLVSLFTLMVFSASRKRFLS